MITIDMALLPVAVQRRITAALADGETIALEQAGLPVAVISKPSQLLRGFQIGNDNTQVNQF